MSKELIGKKARIVSLGQDVDPSIAANTFNVGDTVQIVENYLTGYKPNRIKFEGIDGKYHGFINIEGLQILDETPSNGILKVNYLGINIEGSVNDVLTLLKGLR